MRYASRSKRPFSLLIHDDAVAFAADPAEKRRRRESGWPLGPPPGPPVLVRFTRTRHSLPGLPAAAESILPPIPGSRPPFVTWRTEFTHRPKVYYAGYVWPAQFPFMSGIAEILHTAGADLVVIGKDTPKLREFFATCFEISYLPPFSRTARPWLTLRRTAAGIVVSYSETVGEMPWIATSFPSKLIEYLQLGLPCAIMAPADSAVGAEPSGKGYVDFFQARSHHLRPRRLGKRLAY